MVDAASIAELYVKPTVETKELYKALRFRIPTHELQEPLQALGDSLLLRRTRRYWMTRVPPIKLPVYEEFDGDAQVLQERIEALYASTPDLDGLIAWWTTN